MVGTFGQQNHADYFLSKLLHTARDLPSTRVLTDASEDARKRRQKRLFLQREQAAKSCKRLELKIKQNGLQQQLVEKKER